MVWVDPCHYPPNCQGSPSRHGNIGFGNWKDVGVLLSRQALDWCGLVDSDGCVSSVPFCVQWSQLAPLSSSTHASGQKSNLCTVLVLESAHNAYVLWYNIIALEFEIVVDKWKKTMMSSLKDHSLLSLVNLEVHCSGMQ